MTASIKPNHGLQTEREKAWSVEIAAYFRTHRIDSGISITEIAELLNPGDAASAAEHLRACEAGTASLSLDEVFTLTNVMNLPPEDVMAIFNRNFGID
ncbi:MAG TPA: hypothetical protein VM432_13545 [Bdellovibrionales bacterium]|nr:hypothetical protein [Bdellovibrionales bacterium]